MKRVQRATLRFRVWMTPSLKGAPYYVGDLVQWNDVVRHKDEVPGRVTQILPTKRGKIHVCVDWPRRGEVWTDHDSVTKASPRATLDGFLPEDAA